MKNILLSLLIILLSIGNLAAQKDSIIFKNNNFIVGEVKTMDRNILKIETDYSKDDFTIKWTEVKEIYTKTYFLITLTNGSRYNGTLRSANAESILIISDKNDSIITSVSEIVVLDDIDKGFWSQVNASIDFGFDLTKANDFRQISMRSNLGYTAKRWQLSGTYNSLISHQKEIEDINRTDGGVSFKYFLPHDWYPLASIDFLSNNDQQLDLRTTGKLGFGKYVIHTNRSHWGFSVGANYNSENYTPDSIPDRESLEGFLGTELNLFNVGDLSLIASAIAYPSFTESGRWRSDFKVDAKYDLPLDFYIKLGFTLNYDNQPAAGSPDTDYVMHSGFGWSW